MSIAGLSIFDRAVFDELISDNKTLAKIESDIKKRYIPRWIGHPLYGSQEHGNSFYELSSIKSKTICDDNSKVDADIVCPVTSKGENNASTVAGSHLHGNRQP